LKIRNISHRMHKHKGNITLNLKFEIDGLFLGWIINLILYTLSKIMDFVPSKIKVSHLIEAKLSSLDVYGKINILPIIT
jgi:hypothetical protein